MGTITGYDMEWGVLIETSWNVKKLILPKNLQQYIVLIETSWNVKVCGIIFVYNCYTVLIETSWNVKFPGLQNVPPNSFCINRNIVECKEHNPRRKQEDLLRINRNIVECKDRYPSIHSPLSFVLIETSWNVKLYTTFYIVSIHRINRNIVECKDAISINFMHLIICINRSIVECKGTTLDLL